MSEINKTSLFDSNGNLIPIHIELNESSGPVAPPYQFNLSIVLKNEGSGLRINYSYEGKFSGGEPQEQRAKNELIPKDKSIEILNSLFDLNAFSMKVELRDEIKNNVGISFNELNLKIGNGDNAKIRYTLGDLDEPDFEAQTKVIEFIKQLDK